MHNNIQLNCSIKLQIIYLDGLVLLNLLILIMGVCCMNCKCSQTLSNLSKYDLIITSNLPERIIKAYLAKLIVFAVYFKLRINYRMHIT